MITAAMNMIAYRKHRERVFKTKSEVDHESPRVHVANQVRFINIKTDASQKIRTMKENINLLKCINRTARTFGIIDSFPKPMSPLNRRGRLFTENQRLGMLERVNRVLGQRILLQQSNLHTRVPAKRSIRFTNKSKQGARFQLPNNILAKYGENVVWNLPRSIGLQHKLLRPRIYIQLAVKDIRPLGRLVIELYTEASPQVVLQFFRVCSAPGTDRLSFLRLFPGLWLEGELLADPRAFPCKQQEYDMRALNHASGAGIVSYSSRYLSGFKRGFLNFAISFKPLSILNRRRVAFGKVVQGLRILDCIQDYGTKNGKPRKEIQVTGYGVIL